MNVPWKAIGTRVRFGNWPPMAWAVLALVLASVAVTVVIGIELYSITGHSTPFSTS